MKRVILLRLVASLAAGGALGACATYGQPQPGLVYVYRQPPVEPVEVIPTSPGFNYVWVGGHWGWASNDFRWVRGSWLVPASGYHTWVVGRWDRDRRGWYYIDGHWR